MSRAHRLSVATFALTLVVPVAWFACGGESKPAESPSNESTSASASPEPAASESAPAASSAAETPAPTATAEATATATAAAPPPSPSFDSTDCGKCVDKACAKQEAACEKDADCKSALDGMHSCTGSGTSCIDSASTPSAAKAKKLAAAVQACGKKAAGSKACKAKCQ